MKKKVLFVSVLATLALSACTIEIPLFPLPESTQESGNSQTTESGNTSTTSQGGGESQGGNTSTTSQGGTSQGGSESQGGNTSTTSQTSESQGGGSSQGSTSQGGTSESQGGTSQSSEQQKIQRTHLQQTYQEYAAANLYGCDYCPKTGNPKLLIVPVWFEDSDTYITSTSQKNTIKSNIQKAYLGSKAETGWHSVKTYYEEESNNALSLTGVVTDWWECGVYADDCDEATTEALVDEAVTWYFSSHSSERKSFDTDGNGYLDGVMLIYGAPNSLNDNDNLWAYCYWTSNDANKNAPTSNVFFWASYDFMSEDTSHCTIDAHTYIHEMGHVLGLDDYYDYSKQYKPAGGFSMQDYNVGGHDAFSVMAYGWADPYIPTTSQTIEIGAFQTTKECILLTPSWNAQNSVFDEYLLLELYTPTGLNLLDSTYSYAGGYPQGPSDTGIRLWHVDARLAMCTDVTSGNEPVYGNQVTINLNDSRAIYGVQTAMSNTYYKKDSSSNAYCSPLGSNYYDYNLLQLIRNKTSANYKPTSFLSGSDLFKSGSTFNMSTYAGQFKNSGKLNSNTNLGWSFSVTINGSGADATASVTVTKA